MSCADLALISLSAELGSAALDGDGALGPVTNLASRLSTHARSGQIVIGQRVFAAVEETVQTAPLGDLNLKGFGRAITAYQVIALR